jgi:membrane associated rhomboid family serine protease
MDNLAPFLAGTPLAGAPVATVLLAITVAVSLLALNGMPQLIERGVFRPHWVARQNEWHTVVTSAFLHADLPHLLFNGISFFAFAFSLERRMGSAAFAGLYAFGIVVSSAITWWRHRGNPGYRTLGASGAVLAVLFAFIVYFPTARLVVFPVPMPLPAPVFALAYLTYSIWSSKRGGGRINHDAHLGGAAAGVLFVALTDPQALSQAVASLRM